MREAILMMMVAVCLSGAATQPEAKDSKDAPRAAEPSEDTRLAIRNQGYSLLYQLLDDQKNVSKLLIIKKEQSDVGDLITKIAKTSGEAAKQLEAFSKTDPQLHLKMDGLPAAERETRDLISKTRAKELITKTGEKFELRILLTQSEALTYGAHLAAIVQIHETDESRRKVLGDISRHYQDLHQALIDLMHARWRSPAPTH